MDTAIKYPRQSTQQVVQRASTTRFARFITVLDLQSRVDSVAMAEQHEGISKEYDELWEDVVGELHGTNTLGPMPNLEQEKTPLSSLEVQTRRQNQSTKLIELYKRQNACLDAQLRTMYIDFLATKHKSLVKRQHLEDQLQTEERLRPESAMTLPLDVQKWVAAPRRMCGFLGLSSGHVCTELAMPGMRFCPSHAWHDPEQHLYVQCMAVSRREHTRCGRSALKSGTPLCAVHRGLQKSRSYNSAFALCAEEGSEQMKRFMESKPPTPPTPTQPIPTPAVTGVEVYMMDEAAVVAHIKGHVTDIQRERTRIVLDDRRAAQQQQQAVYQPAGYAAQQMGYVK